MAQAPERPALEFDDASQVVAALRDKGHRVSASARAVLDALFKADGPVSADDIAAGEIDLTSVYRNLERLQELGVVAHVHAGHGPGLYALARGGPREYLVCEGCHRVTSIDPSELEPVRDLIRERFGYLARFSHFPIHGYCDSCAQRTGVRQVN
jgi:Fur family ferric uptake transcriptional regulator